MMAKNCTGLILHYVSSHLLLGIVFLEIEDRYQRRYNNVFQ